jgi:predicted permease
LKCTRTTTSAAERRALGGVVTVQIVLTVILLAAAALLARTVLNLDRLQPGYETDHVLAMTVTTMERQTSADFHRRALDRVSAVPGITGAAFAWGVPLTGNKWPGDLVIPNPQGTAKSGDHVAVSLRSVTQDYFSVMGIKVAEGRAFRESDGPDAPRVAMINATLAERYYAGRNPIGAPLQLKWGGGNDNPIEIVGVIADVRSEGLDQPADAEVYLPFWQISPLSKHLVVRVSGDPATFASRIREELRSIEPSSAVERMTTMAEIRRNSTAPRTFAMRLVLGFAAVAIILAALGIYGVLSMTVNARFKEMAVRQAVGAQRHQIVQLVIAEAARLTAAGVAIGALSALFVGRVIQTQLFGVGGADPLSLTIAIVAIAMVALMAGLLPAYRASRVNLVESLRQE